MATENQSTHFVTSSSDQWTGCALQSKVLQISKHSSCHCLAIIRTTVWVDVYGWLHIHLMSVIAVFKVFEFVYQSLHFQYLKHGMKSSPEFSQTFSCLHPIPRHLSGWMGNYAQTAKRFQSKRRVLVLSSAAIKQEIRITSKTANAQGTQGLLQADRLQRPWLFFQISAIA